MVDKNISRLGPFYLMKKIGEGGMGQVFAGYKLSEGKIATPFAIKILDDSKTTPALLEHIKAEAAIASTLRHSSVASFFEMGVTDNCRYLVMEFVEGITLKRIIDDLVMGKYKLEPQMILYIASLILEGVDYLHRFKDPLTGKSQEIVHGDLSPSNVMINFEGELKLIDFGLSNYQEQKAHTYFMNVFYASPRRYMQSAVTPSDDIFGFGVMLWELFAGKRYYQGQEGNIGALLENFAPKSLRLLKPELSDSTLSLVDRCLKTQTPFGFHSVAELYPVLQEELRKMSPLVARAELRRLMSLHYEDEQRSLRQMRKSHEDLLFEGTAKAAIGPDQITASVRVNTPGAKESFDTGDNPFVTKQKIDPSNILVSLGPDKIIRAETKPSLLNSIQASDEFLRKRTGKNLSLVPTWSEFKENLRLNILFLIMIGLSCFMYVERESAKIAMTHNFEKAMVVAGKISSQVSKRTVANTAPLGRVINIESNPPNAEIFIGATKSADRTPANVGIPEDDFVKVTVRLDGFKDLPVFVHKKTKSVFVDLNAGTFKIEE